MVGHIGHEGGEEAGSDHEVPGSDVELQLQEAVVMMHRRETRSVSEMGQQWRQNGE